MCIRDRLIIQRWLHEVVPAKLQSRLVIDLTRSQRQRLSKAGVPSSAKAEIIERVAGAVGVDSAGGYTVPEVWSDMIVESAAKEYGALAAGATVIDLDSFGQLNIPHDANESAVKGRLVAENTVIPEATLAFGERVITPYSFTSDVLPVSYSLLLQSKFDLVSYITRRLDERLCLLYTSPSPRDRTRSRMPSSA